MMFGFALSGLQDFLYDLSPQSQSRQDRIEEGGREADAATRLRTRSAILTLVPALVFWQLREYDKNAKIIYLGGGKLLATANGDAITKLEKKLWELYGWLAQRSAGKLGACWTSTEDEVATSDTVRSLLTALNAAKWHAGRPNGQWHECSDKIEKVPEANDLGDRNWESGEGKRYAKDAGILQGFTAGVGRWKIGPWRAEPTEKPSDNKAFIPLAKREPQEDPFKVAIPSYTPKHDDKTVKRLKDENERDEDLKEGETLRLHQLAELGEGAPYLALLKLDGDKIGDLMDSALKADPDLERYGEVSRTLTKFFGPGLMNRLKDQFPNLYLVYSGGDDMVACGHFKDVQSAALDIRKAFMELGLKGKDGNPATVSAGVSFFTRNSPILKAIEEAEEELENAKKVRNAISMGGVSLKWDDAQKAFAEIDALVEAIGNEHINRGALQLLRQLGEPWLPEAPKAQAGLRYRSIPLMHYMRSRRTGWKESEWPPVLTTLFDSLQDNDQNWPRAALVGTLAAWRTKRRQEEE